MQSLPLCHSLSLHDALPIYIGQCTYIRRDADDVVMHFDQIEAEAVKRGYMGFVQLQYLFIQTRVACFHIFLSERFFRSEEHTTELQSRFDRECRLQLEKKTR